MPVIPAVGRTGPEALDTRGRERVNWALDDAARAAMESILGRPLANSESAAMGAKLLEFARIVRGWERKTTALEVESG
jgi:hypothetical protein